MKAVRKNNIKLIFVFLICLTIMSQFVILAGEASYEDKQKYFRKLLTIQQEMKNQVEKLKSINQQTIHNANNFQRQPALQKAVLEEGVANQRQIFEDAFKKTAIPLQENYWACKDLTDEEEKLIEEKIKNLKDKTSHIENELKHEGHCTRNTQLTHHVRFLKLHIDSLENELGNACDANSPYSVRKDTKPTDNLYGTDQNWIYGDLRPQDYRKQQQALEQKYNLEKCPQQRPFIVKQKCQSPCQKENQIFDLSQRNCIDACPQGEIFLKYSHECRNPDDKQKVSNLDPDNTNIPFIWGGLPQDQYKKQIEELRENDLAQDCSEDEPLSYRGQSCMKECEGQQVYDLATKQCHECKHGQKYVSGDHSCKALIRQPNSDSENANNWVIVDPSDKDKFDEKLQQYKDNGHPIQKCPQDEPFPSKDMKQCIDCQQGKLYDYSSGQCRQCEKYFTWDESSHQCKYNEGDCKDDKIWNGQKCIMCNDNGFYDNNFRKCVCQDDHKYDQQTGNCLPFGDNLKNANPDKATNFIGEIPPSNKFLGNCPDDRPFYNSEEEKCIECTLPNHYYDFNENSCQTCPSGEAFNSHGKICEVPVNTKNNKLDGVSNYCCGEAEYDDSKQTCPDDSPFFDGFHCVACSKPKYFNLESKKCQSCPDGESFDSNSKKCVDSNMLTPKIKSNIPDDRKNYYGDIPVVNPDIEGQQIKSCPNDKPYSNGQECLKCELPNYFNFESKQCQICRMGTSFNTDSRTCATIVVPNIDDKQFFNSNMIGAENFIGRVPEYKRNYPQCQDWKRYFNGRECTQCDLPKFFNFDNNQCSECDSGKYFDKEARKCFVEDQPHSTSTDAENIYYNGDFQRLKQDIRNEGKPVCKADRPFFDKEEGQCINCQGDNYLWNIKKNHCMNCPGNMHFNAQNHICFQNGVSPTIERMAMNSVSWI